MTTQTATMMLEAIRTARTALHRQILANGKFTDEEKKAFDALTSALDAAMECEQMTEEVENWNAAYNAYTR